MTRHQLVIGLVLLAATAAAGTALSQPPGFGQQGGMGGPGGMRPGAPRLGPNGGMDQPNMGGPALVDMYECEKCKHRFASATTPSRCPNCNQVFNYIKDENGRKTVTPERNKRNAIALGFICVIVVLAAIGGGIFLLVKMLSSKPRKRKKIRRQERDDDFDDDEDDRRRSRDDRDDRDDDDDRPRRRRRD